MTNRQGTPPAGASYETLLPRVLAASGDPTFGDAASVSISYPTFFADLERIRS